MERISGASPESSKTFETTLESSHSSAKTARAKLAYLQNLPNLPTFKNLQNLRCRSAHCLQPSAAVPLQGGGRSSERCSEGPDVLVYIGQVTVHPAPAEAGAPAAPPAATAPPTPRSRVSRATGHTAHLPISAADGGTPTPPVRYGDSPRLACARHTRAHPPRRAGTAPRAGAWTRGAPPCAVWRERHH